MLLRSGLSFRICYNLLLVPDIYVSVTNLVRCKIYMVGFRIVYFLVLFRIFQFFVSAVLLSFVFLLTKLLPPQLYSSFFSNAFCLISSNIFFNSSVFSFIFSRSFLSVIAVIYLENSNSSAEIVPKLHSFSISLSRLQKFSGVSSSDYFVQKKSPRLW